LSAPVDTPTTAAIVVSFYRLANPLKKSAESRLPSEPQRAKSE
jgi:hypothetical protein